MSPSIFHFLRPWWLIALLPAAILIGGLARTQSADWMWRGIVAEHLLRHLFLKRKPQRCFGPLILLATVWTLVAVAPAGMATSPPLLQSGSSCAA